MNVKHPEAWLIQPVKALHDLDNLKFEQMESKKVSVVFELEHVLLEGHCYSLEHQPPSGLQITLGDSSDEEKFDTIVMANLGYFQLKAEPGIWNLRLRNGPSKDIYHINSYDGSNGLTSIETVTNHDSVDIIMDSYHGLLINLKVDWNEGQQGKDILEAYQKDAVVPKKAKKEKKSMFESIKSSMGFGSKVEDETDDDLNLSSIVTDDENDKINIFSLASGHLYERFMRMMMVSVRRHTTAKLVFWALKNYASPQFIESVPAMEEKYNIEIKFVQYKWPQWLRRQREKQRTMWGYKILFLDVLFPLNVDKIIFVDADQIVRTDMRELRDMDLEGNPYGYTPFCSDRTEMDGFRFWKGGYWERHLGNRAYHISALYVIDLIKFRQLAAGDRLRGQYQGLSADPNSLANLDQDLPNNMIHQVGIKSLPQEWLWCETWCSDKSKAKAKTIDLCNNPLTKEPKLEAAVRIVPEWAGIDQEIKDLLAGKKNIKINDQSKDEL